YSEKLTVGSRLVGLRPLFNVVPVRRDDGRFDYRVTEDGRSHVLPPGKVFHVRGFGGGDGLGMSAIRFGVQSFGSALAADETAARVFSNAMMPSGVIESDQTLTPEQRAQLGRMLDAYVSSDRAGKTLALEAGLKYRQLQMNPEDAQLLETRRFQVEDVCRWFGTPPVVIGHAAQGQTMWGTGVEAIMMAWLRTGINPLLRRLESRILKDLIPAAKRGRWALGARPGVQGDLSPRALQRWSPDVRAADPGEASISVLDPIGADPWGEGVTARRISAALRAIGERPVTVNIN
ncbi:phage portal protein, partial [Rhodovulum sulfidophilum]|uniref:phage portal protein n=1 Tax=Rhodovulum sulfidophilum TaxID=35806 RepID=UPI001C4DA60D